MRRRAWLGEINRLHSGPAVIEVRSCRVSGEGSTSLTLQRFNRL